MLLPAWAATNFISERQVPVWEPESVSTNDTFMFQSTEKLSSCYLLLTKLNTRRDFEGSNPENSIAQYNSIFPAGTTRMKSWLFKYPVEATMNTILGDWDQRCLQMMNFTHCWSTAGQTNGKLWRLRVFPKVFFDEQPPATHRLPNLDPTTIRSTCYRESIFPENVSTIFI